MILEAVLVTTALGRPTTGILYIELGYEFGSEVPSNQSQEGKAFNAGGIVLISNNQPIAAEKCSFL